MVISWHFEDQQTFLVLNRSNDLYQLHLGGMIVLLLVQWAFLVFVLGVCLVRKVFARFLGKVGIFARLLRKNGIFVQV